jgi:hypothetical protein
MEPSTGSLNAQRMKLSRQPMLEARGAPLKAWVYRCIYVKRLVSRQFLDSSTIMNR